MPLNTTDTHRAELLLTLYYLVKHTDENHPAVALRICESANEFGLHFDKNKEANNDVKRQRVSEVLAYLERLSRKFREFPFEIERTKGGKYFVKKRFNLLNEDVLDILESIKNSKYQQTAVLNNYIGTLANILASDSQKDELFEKLDSDSQASNSRFNKNLRVVKEALNGKKVITLIDRTFESTPKNNGIRQCILIPKRYLVYAVREVNNKLCGIFVPLTAPSLLCQPIEDLNISPIDTLIEDIDPKRNLNKLFLKNNSGVPDMNEPIKWYIRHSKKISPKGGAIIPISFYFKHNNFRLIANRYQDFFNESLKCIRCDGKSITEYKESGFMSEIIENPNGDYCLVTENMNLNSFLSWMMSDVDESGDVAICEAVAVLEPERLIGKKLADRYLKLCSRYFDYIK